MANKKKNNFNTKKKKTTKKSNSTPKKVSTSKKTTSTVKKKSTATTKTTSTKKVAVKKTPTKKTTASKKVAAKKTPTKKPNATRVVKKKNIKLIDEEAIKIENNIDLPKLKTDNKEVSKNKNKPERVIKTEEFTVIKKEPIRYEGKEKKVPVEGKRRVSKSNAKKIEKRKKNDFLKSLDRLKRKIKVNGINSVIPIKYMIMLAVIILLLIFTPTIIELFDNKPKIDLSSIPSKVDSLNTVSFDIEDVPDIIASSEAYSSLKDYYEYDFKDVIGLNPTYVSSYVIKVNKSKKQAFIAVKPVDKYYDEVKTTIDNFLKDNDIKNYQYLEYQGYQIYIKSNNDLVVVSKIKQSQQRVFNIMKDLKKDDIEKELKISDSDYEEALVKTPMVVKSDTCGYIVIKPKNQSSKEKIKNLIDDYYKGLEAKWQNNEENRKLVQNRYFEEYKGYLIYVVSHDNNLAIQLMKS